VQYLEGAMSLDECIATVQKNTRHYAKRQETWFKNQLDARKIPAGAGTSPADEILAYLGRSG